MVHCLPRELEVLRWCDEEAMKIVMEQVHSEVVQCVSSGRWHESREEDPSRLLELECLGLHVKCWCSHCIPLHQSERHIIEGFSPALSERTKPTEMQTRHL